MKKLFAWMVMVALCGVVCGEDAVALTPEEKAEADAYITEDAKATIGRYLWRCTPREDRDQALILKHVKYFVSQGADVNAIYAGTTPLYFAVLVCDGNTEIVKYLVEQGADVNAQGKDAPPPIHVAVMKGSIEVVKYLLSQGADVNAKHIRGMTPLYFAAWFGDVELFKYLVSQGADVNAEVDGGQTLAIAAAHNRDVEVIQYIDLVFKGVDVNVKGKDGHTPLHAAVGGYKFNPEVVKFIVSKGADVNVKNNNGKTPLHAAAMYNEHAETVKFLVDHGADVHAKDNDGKTPLHVAATNFEGTEVAKLLIIEGADVNAKDNDGKTPLHVAAEHSKNVEVIKFLASLADAEQRALAEVTQFAGKGRKIVVGIVGANTARANFGFSPIWPRAQGDQQQPDRDDRDRDIADKMYTNTSDYFWDLMNRDNLLGDDNAWTWAPFCVGFDFSDFSLASMPEMTPIARKAAFLKGDYNDWCIIADLPHNAPDNTPIMFSKNFDITIEDLAMENPDAADPQNKLGAKVGATINTPFGKDLVVVIQKGGAVRIIKTEELKQPRVFIGDADFKSWGKQAPEDKDGWNVTPKPQILKPKRELKAGF